MSTFQVIPRETIAEIRRHRSGTFTVEGDPPLAGQSFWARPTPKSRPVCEMRVIETWPVGEGRHEVLVKPVRRPYTVPRLKSDPPAIPLSREQIARLLAGNASPLPYPDEPTFDVGATRVLLWSRPRPTHDGRGHVARPDRQPLVWITVKRKSRHRTGGWLVQVTLEDLRESPPLLVRSIPPMYDQELMRADAERREENRTAFETLAAEASLESNYTSDPSVAVDHLEAIDAATRKRFASEAARGDDQEAHLNQLRRERYELEQRLLEVRARADREGVDISSPMRVIERQLEKIEKRVYRGEAA